MWYNINIKLYINISVFFTVINTFLVKTKQIIKNLIPQKNGARLFLFFAISVGIFLSVSPAYAGIETLPTDFANTLITTGAKLILLAAQVVIKLTVFFLAFFLKLANYNGFIDAPVVIIGWTMIRDVANMFFVVILLAIAFGTILGLEQYEWKRTMAKFIMAAILINFSRLICGLILDAAHVFTMTFANAVAATAGGNIINMLHLDSVLKMTNSEIALENSTDIRMDILVAAIMGLIFAIIGMMSIAAYAMIMVIRVVVLWVLIILSPLPYIFGVLQKTKSYGDEWWSEFSKHVLVAPIAVFFLWLGFATLGSGNFAGPDLGLSFDSNQESQAASAIGLKKDNKNTSVSISEITTWENMANFIIAIAFLWIGLDQVQKTGVKGASTVINKAKEYTGKGVRKVAWHAPMGGRFWTRQGKTAFNRVKLGFNESKIRQAEGAANRDKKGLVGGLLSDTKLGKKYQESDSKFVKGLLATDKLVGKYGVNRLGGALSGGLIGDTSARADKRASDWEDTVERQEKVLEESYGTGSASEGGQRKTDMTARLQQKEEFIAQKKEQKILEKRKEMEEEIEKMGGLDAAKASGGSAILGVLSKDSAKKSNIAAYAADAERTATTQAKKEIADDSMKSRKDLRAAEARDKVESDIIKGKKGADFDRDVMATHQRNADASLLTKAQDEATNERKNEATTKALEKNAEALQAVAKSQLAMKDSSRKNEILEAKAKDKALSDEGKIPRYVDFAQQKHMKEDVELASAGSYDKGMAQQTELLGKILGSTKGTADTEKLQREFVLSQASNMQRGSAFATGGLDNAYGKILEANGKSIDNVSISAGDNDALVAKTLTVLSGELVGSDKSSIDSAMTKLENIMGDQFTPLMQAISSGQMKSGSDGAINLAGQFREVINSSGQSKFRAVHSKNTDIGSDGKTDIEWANGKKGYASSTVKATSVQGISGSIDKRDGAPAIVSKEAIDRIANIFGKVTSNMSHSVSDLNINDLNAAFKNMEIHEIQTVVTSMRNKATDDKGIRSLLNRTNLKDIPGSSAITIDGSDSKPQNLY